MFRDYLYGNNLMIFNDIGSDSWQQYIMNYTSIVNHLRDGSFSLWDFNNGLGINQFNFNLFDPFLMLLYGAGVILGPAHMLLYINVIQILKIMVAAFAFYWFLSQFSFSVLSRMITSYAYALNGFSSGVGTALSVWNCCDLFSADASFSAKSLFRRKRVRHCSRSWYFCAESTAFISHICVWQRQDCILCFEF